MIVDTSVILAIVLREADHHEWLERLDAAGDLGIGTPTLVETGIVLEGRLGLDSRAILERLLSDFRIAAVPFGDEHWREAAAAFHRFGKGRHPAALNFGDCLCYATARLSGKPLLCKGDDFPQTDLQLA